jgi:hypothetical protein
MMLTWRAPELNIHFAIGKWTFSIIVFQWGCRYSHILGWQQWEFGPFVLTRDD